MGNKIDRAAIAYNLENSRLAIETLVRSHTWGGGNQVDIDTDESRPGVRVRLGVPGTQPMGLTATVMYGGEKWLVDVSGWSWQIQSGQMNMTEQIAHHVSAMRILAAVGAIVEAACQEPKPIGGIEEVRREKAEIAAAITKSK